MPAPGLEETQDFIDCYNAINNMVNLRIGLFDKDLVEEFFSSAIKGIINLIGKPVVSRMLTKKLGQKVSDLISILWDILI
jgi:hypothetical protein